MKHLRTYEGIKYLKMDAQGEEMVWKVPTKKPHFQAALYKLGMPLKEIVYWINEERYYDISKHTHILIFKMKNGNWMWNETIDRVLLTDKYKGEINVSMVDIKIYKVAKKAKKYNI